MQQRPEWFVAQIGSRPWPPLFRSDLSHRLRDGPAECGTAVLEGDQFRARCSRNATPASALSGSADRENAVLQSCVTDATSVHAQPLAPCCDYPMGTFIRSHSRRQRTRETTPGDHREVQRWASPPVTGFGGPSCRLISQWPEKITPVTRRPALMQRHLEGRKLTDQGFLGIK